VVTIFLFFISFHCSQLFYYSLSPTAALASLNTHVVSANFAKTLICKHDYDVILHHHKQRISSNKVTIGHCLILDFRRGHAMQQSPRASPDLCTPLFILHEKNMGESVAMLSQVWKIHVTVRLRVWRKLCAWVNSLIKLCLYRLLFTQCETTWLVRTQV